MARFVVRHAHPPERCPAQDTSNGSMLLNHLSRGNLARFGVRIHGEAVVKGEHTLYLIAEAANESQLRRFLAPFEEVGSVDIFPACASDQPDPPKLRGSNDGEGCSHNGMVLAVCYHDSSGHVLLSIATY